MSNEKQQGTESDKQTNSNNARNFLSSGISIICNFIRPKLRKALWILPAAGLATGVFFVDKGCNNQSSSPTIDIKQENHLPAKKWKKTEIPEKYNEYSRDSYAETIEALRSLGITSFQTNQEVKEAYDRQELIPITSTTNYSVDQSMGVNLVPDNLLHCFRSLRAQSKTFLDRLSAHYMYHFNDQIPVSGLTRSVPYQQKLLIQQKASGTISAIDDISTHTFGGTTFDMSRKNMTKKENNFMQYFLSYMESQGVIKYVKERGCYHVTVLDISRLDEHIDNFYKEVGNKDTKETEDSELQIAKSGNILCISGDLKVYTDKELKEETTVSRNDGYRKQGYYAKILSKDSELYQIQTVSGTTFWTKVTTTKIENLAPDWNHNYFQARLKLDRILLALGNVVFSEKMADNSEQLQSLQDTSTIEPLVVDDWESAVTLIRTLYQTITHLPAANETGDREQEKVLPPLLNTDNSINKTAFKIGNVDFSGNIVFFEAILSKLTNEEKNTFRLLLESMKGESFDLEGIKKDTLTIISPFTKKPETQEDQTKKVKAAQISIKDFITQNKEALDAAEQTYGVPKSLIVAILYIETHFNPHVLTHNPFKVLLSTLFGFQSVDDSQEGNKRYHRRQNLRVGELISLIKDCNKRLQGSTIPDGTRAFRFLLDHDGAPISNPWGAIGLPQFLSSSMHLMRIYDPTSKQINTPQVKDPRLLMDPGNAAASTASYLSRANGNKPIDTEAEKRKVIREYNHSTKYVNDVMKVAEYVGSILHGQENLEPLKTVINHDMPSAFSFSSSGSLERSQRAKEIKATFKTVKKERGSAIKDRFPSGKKSKKK